MPEAGARGSKPSGAWGPENPTFPDASEDTTTRPMERTKNTSRKNPPINQRQLISYYDKQNISGSKASGGGS